MLLDGVFINIFSFLFKTLVFAVETFFEHIDQIVRACVYIFLITLSVESFNKGFTIGVSTITSLILIVMTIVFGWIILWNLILKHLDFVQEFLGTKPNKLPKYQYFIKKRK
jgi:hypothetical protein